MSLNPNALPFVPMNRGKLSVVLEKPVWGCVRISSPGQLDGNSLQAQRDAIMRWCDEHGSRPARMIEFVRSAKDGSPFVFRNANTVYVFNSVDRYTRNLADVAIVKEMLQYGCEFVFLREELHLRGGMTSDQEAVLVKAVNTAVEEIKTSAARLNESRTALMNARKRTGKRLVHGNRVRYGFTTAPFEGKIREVVPNSEEKRVAQLMHAIFDSNTLELDHDAQQILYALNHDATMIDSEYCNGKPEDSVPIHQFIANILNKNKIYNRNVLWTESSVRNAMRNNKRERSPVEEADAVDDGEDDEKSDEGDRVEDVINKLRAILRGHPNAKIQIVARV